MTIPATLPGLLSPDPVPTGSSGAPSPGADGFAAILAALGGGAGTTPGATPGATPATSLLSIVGGSTQEPAQDTDATDPGAEPDGSQDAAALAITASLAGLVSALAAHGTAPGPTTAPPASLQALVGSVSGESTSPATPTGDHLLGAPLDGASAGASAGGDAPSAPLTLLGHVRHEAGQTHLALLTPVNQPSTDSPTAPAGHQASPLDAPLLGATAPDATPTGVPPLLGGQPAAAAAPTTSSVSGPSETGPVVRQVVPELTRMVSRGEGTHRLWLKLNPDNLGEVRVVLTVKDGDVHVRIAGGTEAQNELLRGAPELHRLLASSGATQTRLELLDHSGRTLATSDSTPSGLDQHVPNDARDAQGQDRGQLAGGAGAESGSTHSDRSARRQPGSDAMDGTGDPTPLSRPSQSVGSSRGNTGLDLTL